MPENAEYPFTSTCQVPGVAVARLQVSALLLPSDLQSYEVVVGAVPNFTYRSASPLPPEVTNFSPVESLGTCIVQRCSLPAVPPMPVTGTPFCSIVPVPPTV